MTHRTAQARALANLALVKYFGKRDAALNLPAAGSLSLALEPLSTVTSVTFDASLETDVVRLDGAPVQGRFQNRVSGFLDLVRSMAAAPARARVETKNAFPTAAGLASSASGFAALALAAARALDLDLDPAALSALARRGSGSACRSIPGGIAVWNPGERSDGADSFAVAVAGPDDWDLRVVIGVTALGPKPIGSTEAMERTRRTSPYYGAWIETAGRDLKRAIAAVETRDFEALGSVSEQNALAMHAAALGSDPAIVFWNGATVNALNLIRSLRKGGTAVYFTCDAGPQPKALCLAADEDAVVQAMSALHGIQAVIRCRLGGAARLITV